MAQNHRTEAACLLEQGTSYRRRIGLEPIATPGDPIFAGFKHGAFSIYHGDAPIYHFDLEGRWQRAFVDGTHYLKGLDASVQAIDRVREGANLVLKRKTLAYAETSEFDARVRANSLELIADLDAGRLGRIEPPTQKAQPLETADLRNFLERISSWDSAAWLAHRERYLATYGPLPFLPPECQNAVVLQATLGRAGGFGSGCSPAAELTTRCPAAFERHANLVAALWGRRLLQSRWIFLAGSDVMHLPVEDVKAYLSAIGRAFPVEPASRRRAVDRADDGDETSHRLEGVHVFLDDFAPPCPDRAALGEFAARGLVRVSLGVESGDPEVRSLHAKNWDEDDLRVSVSDFKAAGLDCSILTLVGAGGIERAEPHVNQTARLLESLDLGPGDFVFLLDENELRDPQYAPAGMTNLHGFAWSQQQAKLREALAPLKRRGVKVLPYTLEKQSV
jgi:hypothetical protein